MKDLTIKQQIANIDIASLSTASDFTHFLNLLKQVDNADFVKNIQLKLNENPLFSQFKKEQQNERTQGMERITAQARLSEIMEKTKGKKGDVLSTRSVIQNQINNANYQAVAAMYEDILQKEGAVGFIRKFTNSMEQLRNTFSDQNASAEVIEQNVRAFNTHIEAATNAISNGETTFTREEAAEVTISAEKTAKKAEKNAKVSQAQLETMNKNKALFEIVAYDKKLAEKLFEKKNGEFVRDENGNPVLKQDLNPRDLKSFDEFYKKKYSENSEYIRLMRKEYPNDWKERVAVQQETDRKIVDQFIVSDIAQTISTYTDRRTGEIKIPQQKLNAILSTGISQALNEPTVGVEGLKQQIENIKKQHGSEINLLGSQFEQFSLYYVNAQRVMKEKGITFAQFLTSKEGNEFGVARQLLNTSYIKDIAKQDEKIALNLLNSLGANENQAKIILKAFKEIENQPQVFEHLTKKAKADYNGGFSWGKAEFVISKDGVEQLLDKKQTAELASLKAKNPDYKQELENFVADDKRKEKELEKEVKIASYSNDFLSEEPTKEVNSKPFEDQKYGENVIRSVAKDGGVKIENNQELEKQNAIRHTV